MKKIITSIIIFCIVNSLVIAQQNFKKYGHYTIGTGSGTVVEVDDEKVKLGDGIFGRAVDQWKINRTNDGYYSIINLVTGLCWDVEGSSYCGNVIVYPYYGQDNQKFYFEGDGIRAKHSGRYIAYEDNYYLKANGSSVTNSSGFWVTSSFRYMHKMVHIKLAEEPHSELCISSPENNIYSENFLCDLDNYDNIWNLEEQNDGSYIIRNPKNNKVWDAAWGASYGYMIQWPEHGGNNQKFQLIPAGDGEPGEGIIVKIAALHNNGGLCVFGGHLV